MDRQTDWQKDIDEQTIQQMDSWVSKQTDRLGDGQIHRLNVGLTEMETDGLTDGWADYLVTIQINYRFMLF